MSAAITYFIAKYNVAVDSSMVLNTIHTDATEVGQLLSLQMIPYVVFLMLIPALVILSIDITFEAIGKVPAWLVATHRSRASASRLHPCT